jgi:hypothetical protein
LGAGDEDLRGAAVEQVDDILLFLQSGHIQVDGYPGNGVFQKCECLVECGSGGLGEKAASVCEFLGLVDLAVANVGSQVDGGEERREVLGLGR